jgi:hypothetical protein
VLALARDLDEGGAVRERFRTLHRRAEAPHRDPRTLPVFGLVAVEGEEEPAEERPDLAALARDGSAPA